ncbi:sigma-E processing peptidase SpoIIGA [Clostridium sp. JN-9]|uniref:sigma-E processing peptidase SpoIIGA n=1 Tax=Clostridium sp. JN-9 TaxID=2507159 RepID=UPI000FFDF95A|nr:sigma-E processing peptidase SpoIIGA [Clostridium sp. JN-9]QAT40117.1 sigma-E processing peptidase SpoIIGA [Clostridium sp. JN-9]
MIIYLDVILFENFIVDFFLLYITLQTIKLRPVIKYLIISSTLGSLYVLTLLIPGLKVLSGFAGKLAAGFIMTFIAVRKKDFFFLLKAYCIFIIYTMLLAGICTFNSSSEFANITVGVIYNFSYKKLMISIMIMYLIIHRTVTFIKDRKAMTNFIYTIDIQFNQNLKSVKAFLDTGNELREPVTNIPVIIAEQNVLNGIDTDNFSKYYIPYKLVDGNEGNLFGVKPSSIIVHMNGINNRVDGIIAVTSSKLSKSGDYNALLPRNII